MMANRKRPLSPHLQIYRPQLTSMTSILHRLSGIYLALGIPVFILWLWSVAEGRDSFECAQALGASVLGRLFLFGWNLAFFYHLLNGIRHLAWDAGWGFDLKLAYKTGWVALIGAGTLSVAAFFLAYLFKAG